jgi:hypothetical protein
MQIASVSTDDGTLRSEIGGWSYEDSSLLVRKSRPSEPYKIFIGYTPSPRANDIPRYTCVLEMLADGWELLGQPLREEYKVEDTEHVQYVWWLQRRR